MARPGACKPYQPHWHRLRWIYCYFQYRTMRPVQLAGLDALVRHYGLYW